MNILFDIGATKTRIAKTKDDLSFETPIIYSTPAQYNEGKEFLLKNISHFSVGEKVEIIAGCIAGPWDNENGTISESINLHDWDNKPLQADLSQAFGAKVLIDNDAAMAGLGEATNGAGRGFHKILYMTISTGVGGAIIMDGQIYERLEPRKQVINGGKSLGELISGRSLEERTGKKPKDITDTELWNSLAKILAEGLHTIIIEHSPEAVVIGGSMMNDVGIELAVVEKYLKEISTTGYHLPIIKKAELGDLGGLYGALAYIKQKN